MEFLGLTQDQKFELEVFNTSKKKVIKKVGSFIEGGIDQKCEFPVVITISIDYDLDEKRLIIGRMFSNQ